MKPYINEDIKENPLYKQIQKNTQVHLKQYERLHRMANDNYLTIDVNSEDVSICSWKEEPYCDKECIVWLGNNHFNTILTVLDTTEEEKQFIKENWTKLIWQIKK